MAEPLPNDHSLFVGDVAPDVTDSYLESFFRQYFPSVRSAKVITDPVTHRSKGFGFVRFNSEADRDRALTEMNGMYVSSRPIRVSLATAKRQLGAGGPMGGPSSSYTGAGPQPLGPPMAGGLYASESDPHNTTLFIGGLNPSVSEDQLRTTFCRYGEIIYTKIPQGKGCGFVQFVDRKAAESAMHEMQGTMLGGAPVRISWGRSSTKATTPLGSTGGHVDQHHAYAPYGAYPVSYGYDYGYSMYSAAPYAYGGYDPYAAYGYGMVPVAAAYPGAPAAGSLASGQMGTSGHASVYDPTAPVNVDKMNTAYVYRQMPMLTANFMHAMRLS